MFKKDAKFMITFDLFILKVKLFLHNKPLLLVLKA